MSSSASVTNETVRAAVGNLYGTLVENGRMGGPTGATPPLPKVDGWAPGGIQMAEGFRLGQRLAEAFVSAQLARLRRECEVPPEAGTEKAARKIGAEIERRITAMCEDQDAEEHAKWFRKIHVDSMAEALQEVLGNGMRILGIFSTDGELLQVARQDARKGS